MLRILMVTLFVVGLTGCNDERVSGRASDDWKPPTFFDLSSAASAAMTIDSAIKANDLQTFEKCLAKSLLEGHSAKAVFKNWKAKGPFAGVGAGFPKASLTEIDGKFFIKDERPKTWNPIDGWR